MISITKHRAKVAVSFLYILFLSALIFFGSCKKKNNSSNTTTPITPVVPTPTVPTTPTTTPTNTMIPNVITLSITDITDTTAVSGGSVISEGASVITAVGICWDEQPAPTLLKSKTIDGAGTGSYASSMKGLKPNTKYYMRAYASNLSGTAYGNEISFTTTQSLKWVVWGNGFPFGNNVKAFVTLGTNVFAATSGNGVMKSSNGDNNWVEVNTGMTDLQTGCMIAKDNALLVGTGSDGVYYSSNNGASWVTKNAGLSSLAITDMVVSGGNIFLTSGTEVYMSSDNGNIWSNVSPSTPNIYPGSMAAAGTSVYFLDDINGYIYVSTDNGGAWTQIPFPPGTGYVTAIEGIGSALFASTPNGPFKTSNNGGNWTDIKSGLPSSSLLINCFGMHNNVIYAGATNNAVYSSTNNGASWSKLGTGLPSSVSVSTLGFYQSSIFMSPYLNFNQGGIYKFGL